MLFPTDSSVRCNPPTYFPWLGHLLTSAGGSGSAHAYPWGRTAPPYSTMDGWRGRPLIRLGIAVRNHADSGRGMSSNPICGFSPIVSSLDYGSEISKTESRLVSLNTWPAGKEGPTSLR